MELKLDKKARMRCSDVILLWHIIEVNIHDVVILDGRKRAFLKTDTRVSKLAF